MQGYPLVTYNHTILLLFRNSSLVAVVAGIQIANEGGLVDVVFLLFGSFEYQYSGLNTF